MLQVTNTNDTVSVTLKDINVKLKDLQKPLLQAAIATRDAAVWRIKTQGGDQQWVPNKAGTHTGIDSGTMWQSIGIAQVGPTEMEVTANTRYAKWFQEGTGIFAGHSAWTIRPKKKLALSWVSNGQRYFSQMVTMPGQPARPFLFFDDALANRITRIFVAALGLAGRSTFGQETA